jgi:hypothetical protein
MPIALDEEAEIAADGGEFREAYIAKWRATNTL